jgi:hypothetical protein
MSSLTIIHELKQEADRTPTDIRACYYLGSMAAEGKVVRQNLPMAKHYLERAVGAEGDHGAGEVFRDKARIRMAMIIVHDMRATGDCKEAMKQSAGAIRLLDDVRRDDPQVTELCDEARFHVAKTILGKIKTPPTETTEQVTERRRDYSAVLQILNPLEHKPTPNVADLIAVCNHKIEKTSALITRMWRQEAKGLRDKRKAKTQKVGRPGFFARLRSGKDRAPP